ncbi:MAG: hypothetical protein M3Y05_12800 [Gemmatimonadota bacterium]|nr:hypothetical protein [Gemmatimonadota bacterium]
MGRTLDLVDHRDGEVVVRPECIKRRRTLERFGLESIRAAGTLEVARSHRGDA